MRAIRAANICRVLATRGAALRANVCRRENGLTRAIFQVCASVEQALARRLRTARSLQSRAVLMFTTSRWASSFQISLDVVAGSRALLTHFARLFYYLALVLFTLER